MAVGDVGHVHLAVERQHVVLAHGEEVDVADDDHLVVFLLEEGVGEHLVRVLRVATGEDLHGLGHAHGGLLQALSVSILAEQGEDALVVFCEFVESLAELCLWIHEREWYMMFLLSIGWQEAVSCAYYFRMMLALL